MSITVNLYYTGENGNALKFAREMESSGTADAIRREEGNLRYEYFQPLQDKETVLLINKQYIYDGNDRNILARYCKGKFVAKPFA